MIVATNVAAILLEVVSKNIDGSAKTNIMTSTVRVYHMVGGVETVVLAAQNLVQVGASNTYRYEWAPATIAAGFYVIEYTLTDDAALTTIATEDLIVGYLEAKIDTLVTNVGIIKEIETGKWEIVGNQLILYQSDNTTEIARFNLFDSGGAATMVSVFKRVKI